MTFLGVVYLSCLNLLHLVFFRYEEIFVKLDELDKLHRITHVGVGLNYHLTYV